MKNGSKKAPDIQPMMVLTIDIGNGLVDKLQLFDLNNIEQETYDFCVKNKLDFSTMQEINTQIQNVLKDKQIEEEQEIENVFQEIKEEDEKITENNTNEGREQESIIITNNSNENETQKGNKNDINITSEKKTEKEKNSMNNSNINSNNNENNKIILENENINSIGSNNQPPKKNYNHSIGTNSNSSNGKENKIIKKPNKQKKKNIKENIKEAFAMAKEKSKQNIILNKEVESNNKMNSNINSNIYEENNNEIKQYEGIGNNKKKNKENNNGNDNKIIKDEKSEKENGADKIGIKINNKIDNKDGNNINNLFKQRKEVEVNIINKGKPKNIIKNKDNNNFNEVNKYEHNNNFKENKQSQKRKKSISYTSSHISGYNPGKELYERGMKFKETEKEKLEALKKNLEVEEEEDNTFTPKINKLSKIEQERIRERRPECDHPSIINNYKQYKKDKFENMKKKSDEEFNKIYTFKPCINRSHSTAKTVKNIKNLPISNMKTKKTGEKNESRFDKLYNYRIDYKENRDKLKEKIYNENSFKPQINDNSGFSKLNIPFNERLQTYSNKSKENKIRIKRVYEKEKGFKEPFKPQINNKKNKVLLKDRDEFFVDEVQKYNNNNKGNNNTNNKNNDNNNQYDNNNNIKINNNSNSIDPFTKLYLYGKKYEQEKNFLAEKYYKEQNKPPKCCGCTENIINRKKDKTFKKIFKILDGDEDNKISSAHMNVSRLPKSIIKILQPIFNELRDENETLNELEFAFVCDQLYLSLPWNDRRELTSFEEIARKNYKKEKIIKEKNNFSFKPRINKRNYSYENPSRIINDDGNTSNINNKYMNFNESNYMNYLTNNETINNNTTNTFSDTKYNNYKYKVSNNIIKNNMNKINNRVNYFNIRISNQNCGGEREIFKKNISDYNLVNNLNIEKKEKEKEKYSIWKNINFNIKGKGKDPTDNTNNNDDKNNKLSEQKINYENFVNIKNSSS